MENDPRHTAIHEAGHAVIGRVLGMSCGPVTITADADSAGHSITADPHAIWYRWERRGRFRDLKTVFLGRVLTSMAGAEAEIALLGSCQGGDGDDRYQVAMMLDSELLSSGQDGDRYEARLRGLARHLCRRHAEKIRKLADALLTEGLVEDDEDVRANAGLAPAIDVDADYWDLGEPAEDIGSLASVIEAPKKR